MAKPKKKLKRIIVKLVFIAIFVGLFFLLQALKQNSYICEYYTVNISRAYQGTLGKFIKIIPFSITELLFILLAFTILVLLIIGIVGIFKLKFLRLLNCLLSSALIVSIVVTAYFATCEFAYNRYALPVNYYESKVESTQFDNILNYFIADLNECCDSLEFKENGDLVNPYSTDELSEICENEYERIVDNEYFHPFTTTVKPMVSSFLYTEFHITGVTCCLTTEANVNTMNVEAGKPFTFLHELAHTKGVMREEDAQQTALCLSLTSEDKFLRYSAYYYTIGAMLDLGNYIDNSTSYSTYYNKLSPKFIKNCQFNSKYWDDHKLLTNIAEWWNNLYLKSSGQEGTSSYQDQGGESDPQTRTITSFSNYQKIYFRVYFGGELL